MHTDSLAHTHTHANTHVSLCVCIGGIFVNYLKVVGFVITFSYKIYVHASSDVGNAYIKVVRIPILYGYNTIWYRCSLIIYMCGLDCFKMYIALL